MDVGENPTLPHLLTVRNFSILLIQTTSWRKAALIGTPPGHVACGVSLWSQLVISASNYVPVNTIPVDTYRLLNHGTRKFLICCFLALLSFIPTTLSLLTHQPIIKSKALVTPNLVKHEPYPLFSKIVSVPSLLSAATSGLASDLGGQ